MGEEYSDFLRPQGVQSAGTITFSKSFAHERETRRKIFFIWVFWTCQPTVENLRTTSLRGIFAAASPLTTCIIARESPQKIVERVIDVAIIAAAPHQLDESSPLAAAPAGILPGDTAPAPAHWLHPPPDS